MSGVPILSTEEARDIPQDLLNLQTHIPRTRAELWHWVYNVLGVAIPWKPCCPGHSSPFDAFASAYFAEDSMAVWWASRGLGGKCIRSSEVWFTPEGRRVRWGDLEGSWFPVLAPTSPLPTPTLALAEDNGLQEVWDITLDSGIVISRTAEHPIMSAVRGTGAQKTADPQEVRLRPAKDFDTSLMVMVPDCLPVHPSETRSPEELSLLGLLLGGCGAGDPDRAPGGTTACPEIVEEVSRCMEVFGESSSTGHKGDPKSLPCGDPGGPTKPSRFWRFMEDTGILGKNASEKCLPDWAFRLPDSQLAVVLNRLWAAGGRISLFSSEEGVKPDVEFAASSRQLRDDVALAMHRLGIPGYKKDLGRRSCRDRSGSRRSNPPVYAWVPYGCFLEKMLSVLGPILGHDADCSNLLEFLRRREDAGLRQWRLQGCPPGYHWERVRSVQRESNVPTTSICVPEGNMFCGPVVEHNTHLLALLALTEQITLGAYINLLGGSGEQSQRVLAYLTGDDPNVKGMFWAAPNAPTWMLPADHTKKESRLINGGVLRALMASQKSVRGPHPQRLRLDECDEMSLDIFEAAQGQTMGANGIKAQTVMSSTWQNPNGTFTKIMEMAKERGWKIFTWCFRENLKSAGGWLEDSEVDRKRREVPEHMWLAEYENQEPNPESRLLTPEVLAHLFSDPIIPRIAGNEGQQIIARLPGGGEQFYHGADWAKTTDWCVDDKTEVFTRRGWLKHDQIELGADEALALNPSTGRAEWQVLQDVFRAHRDREMILMEGPGHSSLTTPDHRWLTWTDGSGWTWRTTETLTDRDWIPTAAEVSALPQVPALPDALVEWVGQKWAEGGLGTEGIPAGLGADPDRWCPDGTPTMEFLLSLTRAQLDLFISTSLAASGATVKAGQKTLLQVSPSRVDAFVSACSLAGVQTRVRVQNKPEGGTLYEVCVYKTRRMRLVQSPRAGRHPGTRIERVSYRGVIWCPVLKHQNWLARRDGRVFYTGNTVIQSNQRCAEGPDLLSAWVRTGRRPWPVMVGMANDRVNYYGGRICHDATGLGGVVHDYLTVPAKGIIMKGKEREDIFNKYIAAIEQGRIVYPMIDFLYNEHKFLTWHDLFGGSDYHPPDSVVSAALAWRSRKYGNKIHIGRVPL